MASVLVVDAEPRVRDLIRATLERAGHQVRPAGAVSEVIESLATSRPDVIIVDCLLGGPHYGIDLLRELRLTRRTSDIPVVVTTGAVGLDVGEMARSTGDAVLPKPFTAKELLHSVDSVLAGRAS